MLLQTVLPWKVESFVLRVIWGVARWVESLVMALPLSSISLQRVLVNEVDSVDMEGLDAGVQATALVIISKERKSFMVGYFMRGDLLFRKMFLLQS